MKTKDRFWIENKFIEANRELYFEDLRDKFIKQSMFSKTNYEADGDSKNHRYVGKIQFGKNQLFFDRIFSNGIENKIYILCCEILGNNFSIDKHFYNFQNNNLAKQILTAHFKTHIPIGMLAGNFHNYSASFIADFKTNLEKALKNG